MRQFTEIWQHILSHSRTVPLLTDRTDKELLGRSDRRTDGDVELAELLGEMMSSNSDDVDHGNRQLLKDLHSQLFFQFYYITDELVFYAHHARGMDMDSISQSGEQRGVLKLATLHYTFVFRHHIFQRYLTMDNRAASPPSLLIEWAKQFSYFMSYIPMQTPATEILFETKRILDRAFFRRQMNEFK